MPCNRAMEIRRTVPRLMRIVAKTFLTLVFCGALLWMNACSVGPNYKRPAANVPTAYRGALAGEAAAGESTPADRKSTRLNSSHGYISYAVFCFKKQQPA